MGYYSNLRTSRVRSASGAPDGQGRTDWQEVAAALPGVDTLAAISTAEPVHLRPSDLVDAIRGCERLLSHVAGLQASLITEFARPGRAGDISRMAQSFTEASGAASTSSGQVDTDVLEILVLDHAHGLAAAELGAALDVAPVTARHRVEAADDLHNRLPGTHLALLEGRIDRGRAALIAERTSILEPELRLRVEATILPLVAGRTAGRLRPLIDRAVLIADPDAAKKRIEKARKNREVTHQPIKDEMSVIRAVLPADGAVSVFTLIDLLADATKSASDGRDVGQRRADALTDLATEMLTHGRLDLRGLLHPEATADDSNDTSDTACTGDAFDPESDWYDDDELADQGQSPDADRNMNGRNVRDLPAQPRSTQRSRHWDRRRSHPPNRKRAHCSSGQKVVLPVLGPIPVRVGKRPVLTASCAVRAGGHTSQ